MDLTNSFRMQLDGAPLCSRKERANQVGNRHSFTRENHLQNVLRSPHRSFSHHYALQWRKSPMAHPTQLGKKPGRKEGSKIETARVRLRRVRHGKDGTADSRGEGRKECVLKSNERGFLAQMTAERRETFVTAPRAAKSLFNSSRNIF